MMGAPTRVAADNVRSELACTSAEYPSGKAMTDNFLVNIPAYETVLECLCGETSRGIESSIRHAAETSFGVASG